MQKISHLSSFACGALSASDVIEISCFECVIILINRQQVDLACTDVRLIRVIESCGGGELLTVSLAGMRRKYGFRGVARMKKRERTRGARDSKREKKRNHDACRDRARSPKVASAFARAKKRAFRCARSELHESYFRCLIMPGMRGGPTFQSFEMLAGKRRRGWRFRAPSMPELYATRRAFSRLQSFRVST